jgi:hypothetical protein
MRVLLLSMALLLGASLVLAPALAQALIVRLPNGHYIGMQLRRGEIPALIPGAAAAARSGSRSNSSTTCPTSPDNGTICYLGGPVLHTIHPYLLFWDPGGAIPSSSRSLIERYLTDVAAGAGANDVYGVARQYYDSTGFADAGQTFVPASQTIDDAQPYPTPANCSVPSGGYTNCITDGDIENELTRLIGTGYPTGTGPGAPLYFVVTPATTDVCFDSTDCASSSTSGFCGYHTNFQVGGQQVIYAVVPFGSLGPSEDVSYCQASNLKYPQEPNGDPADDIIDNLSHESNESITDPIINKGWVDFNSGLSKGSGNEIEDNCQQYGTTADPANGLSPRVYFPILGVTKPVGLATYGTGYDQTIDGDHFFTQTVWSNGERNCEPYPAKAALTPSFTDSRPAATSTSITFNPKASISARGISSLTWGFGDGGTRFVIGTPTTVAHKYAKAGSYRVTLTLVDRSGNLARVTHTVAVR